jgi:UDP-glucose 4-epimerase
MPSKGYTGRRFPKEEAPPRPGDVPGAYANADRAKELIDWEALLPIEEGISDALKWNEVRKNVLNYDD